MQDDENTHTKTSNNRCHVLSFPTTQRKSTDCKIDRLSTARLLDLHHWIDSRCLNTPSQISPNWHSTDKCWQYIQCPDWESSGVFPAEAESVKRFERVSHENEPSSKFKGELHKVLGIPGNERWQKQLMNEVKIENDSASKSRDVRMSRRQVKGCNLWGFNHAETFLCQCLHFKKTRFDVFISR